MADIFISYKREDKKQAALLADKLEAAGWSVWWDHDLLGGEDYDVVIERELSAKAVVVIWSALSIQSRNVKDEAKKALNRGTLVPVSFDATEPPIGFGMTHVVLFENKNKITEQEFRKLYESISKKIQPGYHEPSPQLQPKSSARKYIYYVLGLIILIVAGYFIFNSIKKTNEQTLTADTTGKNIDTTSENNNDTTNTRKETTEENGKTAEQPPGKFDDKLKLIVKDCPELFKNTKGREIKFNFKDGGYDCSAYTSTITISEFTEDTIFYCSAAGGKLWRYQSMLSTGTDSLEVLKKFREYRLKIQYALPDFKDATAGAADKYSKHPYLDYTDGKTGILMQFITPRRTKTTYGIGIMILGTISP